MSGYYVTRQSNYYDDGAYSVEIARQLDYAGPGALSAKYAGEFEEYSNPLEAVKTALSIAKDWRADIGRREDGEDLPFRCFTIAGNAMVYPTVADAMTARELLKWARAEYERLPKCEYCGDIATSEYRDTFGETFHACSEFHADEYVDALYAANEVEA